MSAEFDTWVGKFYAENWKLAATYAANMTQEVNNAQINHNAADYVTAQQHIINALYKVDNMRLALLDTYQYPYPRFNIFKVLEILDDRIDDLEDAPPVTVDMDAILSAMLSAAFQQIEYFIGIVDAYRVSLWNEPFNAEFYAALARGFMK